MTAAQHEPDDTLSFTTAGKRKTTAADAINFKIDGEPFVMVRPKLSTATAAVQLMDAPETRSLLQLSGDLVRVLSGLYVYIQTAPPVGGKLRGRARLDQRLEDPEDSFDLLDLMPVFKAVLETMFNRPTGARRVSPAQPRRTGRASGGASRKPRAKTSGK